MDHSVTSSLVVLLGDPSRHRRAFSIQSRSADSRESLFFLARMKVDDEAPGITARGGKRECSHANRACEVNGDRAVRTLLHPRFDGINVVGTDAVDRDSAYRRVLEDHGDMYVVRLGYLHGWQAIAMDVE